MRVRWGCMRTQVLVGAAASLAPEQLVETFVSFLLLPGEGWRVSATLRSARGERLLGQEELSAERVLFLRRQNNKCLFGLIKTPAEPQGLFTANALHFVQALQEMRCS